jgi:hypothetical protein
MAAGYMECILYIKNLKHGDDIDSDIKNDIYFIH